MAIIELPDAAAMDCVSCSRLGCGRRCLFVGGPSRNVKRGTVILLPRTFHWVRITTEPVNEFFMFPKTRLVVFVLGATTSVLPRVSVGSTRMDCRSLAPRLDLENSRKC